MILQALDWWIIGIFFFILLAIGWVASQSASKNTSEYFLGGRSMPWWLLGISMVATTFSADTPNLVAGLVREGGVANNWAWWAFFSPEKTEFGTRERPFFKVIFQKTDV